jgi:protein TonB
MITHDIKWFLFLSVAAHAAFLAAWHLPAYTPGSSGHVMQLSVIQRAGSNSAQAPAEITSRSAPVNAVLPEQAIKPVTEPAGTATAKTKMPAQQYKVPPSLPRASPAQIQSAAAATDTASTSATVASNPVLQQQETSRHLRNSVMNLISRKLTYPAIARRKGWQGVVKLELHIEADGAITRLQVGETSGYSILDKAAVQCLQLASIPDAARWLHGQAIDIVVPVEYRRVDS